jgi:hypothetical protein
MKETLSQASIERLLNYFDRLIPLSKEKEEKQLVTEKFHPRLYCKRQYALQESGFYFLGAYAPLLIHVIHAFLNSA